MNFRQAHRRLKVKLNDLVLQYEDKLKKMIVMDDYDGGKAEQLRVVIKDLKSLDGGFAK
jgi:hypothetical protein